MAKSNYAQSDALQVFILNCETPLINRLIWLFESQSALFQQGFDKQYNIHELE